MFETDSSHYKTISILGHCCDGLAIVHLAKHIPSDTLVAVKKFNMDKAREEALLIQVCSLIAVYLRYIFIILCIILARNNID